MEMSAYKEIVLNQEVGRKTGAVVGYLGIKKTGSVPKRKGHIDPNIDKLVDVNFGIEKAGHITRSIFQRGLPDGKYPAGSFYCIRSVNGKPEKLFLEATISTLPWWQNLLRGKPKADQNIQIMWMSRQKPIHLNRPFLFNPILKKLGLIIGGSIVVAVTLLSD